MFYLFLGLILIATVGFFFLKKNEMDIWLFLDAIAPAIFIGQALARPANFINQELYGQPTKLPWGIPIDAGHRLAQYADLSKFPVETTRFHPTFAYEMAVIIREGMYRMYEKQEDIFYYLTVGNQNYAMAKTPEHLSREALKDGILRGMYKFKPATKKNKLKAQLFGSASIMTEVLKAQDMLETYKVSAEGTAR